MPLLKLLKGQLPQSEIPLGLEDLLIGRDELCSLQLKDDQVSRHHASVSQSEGRYQLTDLNSRNHTYLNGDKLEPGVPYTLENHDLITILRYAFSFIEDRDDSWLMDDESVSQISVIEDRGQSSPDSVSLNTSASNWQFRSSVNSGAKLSAMMQITRDLHNALALDEVLEKVLDSLLKIFPPADSAVCVLTSPGGDTPEFRVAKQRKAGADETIFISRTVMDHVLKTGQGIIFDDIQSPPQIPLTQSIVNARRRSVVCAPLLDLENHPLGVMQLDTSRRSGQFSDEDLDLLSTVALQVSLAVEDSRLHGIALREREMRRELQVAREIQVGLLPDQPPEMNGYEFFDFYAAAREVGGDYYDYVTMPDGRCAVVVGDVAGKGVSAALLMAKLASEMRVHLASGLAPLEIFQKLNASYNTQTAHWRFVTLVLAIVDPKQHSVQIVNAGHMRPILRDRQGTLHELANDETGLPLGVVTDYSYQIFELDLEVGDLVAMYSDGVSDALSESGEQFGISGLQNSLLQGADSVRAYGQNAIDALQAFVKTQTQTDDICLLCLQRIA